MQVSGYGRIRFGKEWPACIDLAHEPTRLSAMVFERPLEQIVQVRRDDNGDRIGIFIFRYRDDMDLPEGWQNGAVLYTSEGTAS